MPPLLKCWAIWFKLLPILPNLAGRNGISAFFSAQSGLSGGSVCEGRLIAVFSGRDSHDGFKGPDKPGEMKGSFEEDYANLNHHEVAALFAEGEIGMIIGNTLIETDIYEKDFGIQAPVPVMDEDSPQGSFGGGFGIAVNSETRYQEIWCMPHSHLDIGYTHPQKMLLDNNSPDEFLAALDSNVRDGRMEKLTAEAGEQILLFDEHTWGSCDCVTFPDNEESLAQLVHKKEMACHGAECPSIMNSPFLRILIRGRHMMPGCSTRKVLNHAEPDEVYDYCRRMIDIFYKDGGFIFHTEHNILLDVPPEKSDP